MTFLKLCAAQLVLIAVVALPIHAQTQSTTRGFMLGAHLFGVSLDPEDGESDDGGGFGIGAAYGFRNGLSLFLNGNVAHMQPADEDAQDYILGAGDLGVRYTFGTTAARWRPFVGAALSGVSISWENIEFGDAGRVDVEFSGPAFTAGGGLQFFMSPLWALDGALLWSAGNFDEVKINNVTIELGDDDEIKLTMFRLQLGLRYHFAGRQP